MSPQRPWTYRCQTHRHLLPLLLQRYPVTPLPPLSQQPPAPLAPTACPTSTSRGSAAPKSSPSTSARSHKGRNTTLAATSLYVADTSAESPRTSVAPSTLLHTPSAIGVLLHLPVFYFADVLCYLYSVGNLELSDAALELPVFVPLSKCAGLVHCVEP
ncbi:hypothetical protein BHM03_00035138 [Ensete ventricosum]|nr:hypothetical protein BHM03_00035138 [Ensete ventricosum]